MQSVKSVRTLKAISVLAFIAMTSSGAAQAQSLRSADEPAEFPPSSFKASQYVDSRGCVYVRSGRGVATDWVPRVSRDRKILCGFKPSLTAEQVALPVIPDPVVPNAAAPSSLSTDTAVQVATVEANSTRPRRGFNLFQQRPLDTVASLTTTPNVPDAAPIARSLPVAAPIQTAAVQVAAPIAASPAPVRARRATRATFDQAEIVGETCGTNAQGRAVRCTPQSTQPVDYVLKRLPAGVTVRRADGGTLTTTEPTVVRIAVAAPTVAPVPVINAPIATAPVYLAQVHTGAATLCNGLSGNGAAFIQGSGRASVRCGPQAVHPSAYLRGNQVQVGRASAGNLTNIAAVTPRIPDGYKSTFDDGRINFNRGPQTLAGDYQMAQYLSNTVPSYPPNYVYKRTLWQTFFGLPGKYVPSKTSVVATAVPTPQIHLSTKSASVPTTRAVAATTPAAPRVKAVPAGLRYVQVGTFGVIENADKSVARLAAMGFPVASQKLVRNGKTLKSVLAGPFATPEQTAQALAQTRAAGYGDAFARK